jgi:1,4-alpha-glucan branching enzyme
MGGARVALVLHAHLPFVRHPEHREFLEERWLFEAITESYLPLLDVLDGLERDGVAAHLTLSLSPTLTAMLTDPLLRERYRWHLDALVALTEREAERTRSEPAWYRPAALYRERLWRARDRFLGHWRQDLVGAFRGFEERGRLEIATTAATHAVLPLLSATPEYVRAQIAVGMAEHRRHFSRPPRGFWLPECAFDPGLDAELARAGVRWTILDTHGLAQARPQPVHGVHAPVACPSGVAAYGRDPDSATQVWSAESGYPADPWYRDFHRDIGFDLPARYLGGLASGDRQTATGLKYHRITGAGLKKEPYDPQRAHERVAAHVADFVASRLTQARSLRRMMVHPPVIVCPYDAELFGHWWFEGPDWLDAVLRALAGTPGLEAVSLSEDLATRTALQAATPAASTWGKGGHHAVWLSPANEWVYPRLHAAAARLTSLCRAACDLDAARRRALTRALRALLLAQASDWAFMMARGTAVEYATRRTVQHLEACRTLCDAVDRGALDEHGLADLATCDTLFPALDLGVLG